MADKKGSNYSKEIESSPAQKGAVGELASKLRCSFDSWSDADPIADTEKAQFMILLPEGARIKSVEKSAHSNDEDAASSPFQIKDVDGNVLADESDAIGKKLSSEAKILEITGVESAPGALLAANITSGYVFVEFILD